MIRTHPDAAICTACGIVWMDLHAMTVRVMTDFAQPGLCPEISAGITG